MVFISKSLLAVVIVLPLAVIAKPAKVPVYSGLATGTFYGGSGTLACDCSPNIQKYPTAAINARAFTSGTGPDGAGCGHCYHIKIVGSPQDPAWKPTKAEQKELVVKITDECPGGDFCDQTAAKPKNKYGRPVHFDLNEFALPGGSIASWSPYDPNQSTHINTLYLKWTEVDCSHWAGYKDKSVRGRLSKYWGCCGVNPLLNGKKDC